MKTKEQKKRIRAVTKALLPPPPKVQTHHYVMRGKRVYPCRDPLSWAEEFEKDRRVADTEVGPYWVSTVFLGLDHGWGGYSRPVLFETMVFSGKEEVSGHTRRYTTWGRAEKGHARIVERLRSSISSKEETNAVE